MNSDANSSTDRKVVRMRKTHSCPEKPKTLRACLVCKLVKTRDQWRSEGCHNCRYRPQEYMNQTTPKFTGMVAVLKPDESWVARWQTQQDRVPGVYALQVSGRAS